MTEIFRSVCPLDCPDSCGLLIYVDNMKVIKCKGDPEHPFTRGVICSKMAHYEKLVHHPARILTPLKRTGLKGAGAFVPISWEEALKIITGKWEEIMERWGSEAILPYSYAGVMGLIQRNAGHAFFHRLGASRLKRTICAPAVDAGWQVTMGDTPGTDPEEVTNSDLVLLWGTNAASTNMHFMLQVKEAKKNGAHVVLIETYRTRTARWADDVYLVKPGTDGALALGIMHILESEGLTNKNFIEKHVLGYEELKEKILPTFTPAYVEKVTGLSKGKILELARRYGSAKAPFLRLGFGLSRRKQGAMTVRTILCLPAVTGAYAARGGGALAKSGSGKAFDLSLITRPDLQQKETREINMVQLGQALTSPLDPPVKSLYVYHSNPAAVTPGQNRIFAGLQREDLFTVVHERFLTDTALYADIILPAATSLEQHDIYLGYGHFYLQETKPIIPAPAEAKSNWEVFSLLASSMGFEQDIFTWTEKKAVQKLLETPNLLRRGISRERLAEGKAVRLAKSQENTGEYGTQSGKIEISSHKAASQGQPGLPCYIPLSEDVEGDYSFRLIPAPAHFALNSNFSQVTFLRQREGGPHLLLNPGDCQALNLEEGQWVEVYNCFGSCLLRLIKSDNVQKGVAVVPGVWWCSLSPGGKNVNCLIGDNLTDMGEGSTFYDYTVSIKPLDDSC